MGVGGSYCHFASNLNTAIIQRKNRKADTKPYDSLVKILTAPQSLGKALTPYMIQASLCRNSQIRFFYTVPLYLEEYFIYKETSALFHLILSYLFQSKGTTEKLIKGKSKLRK